MTEYFYRKIGSPDFEYSAQPKIIFPVWLPNKFRPAPLYYNSAKGDLEYYDGNYNAFVAENPKLLPVGKNHLLNNREKSQSAYCLYRHKSSQAYVLRE